MARTTRSTSGSSEYRHHQPGHRRVAGSAERVIREVTDPSTAEGVHPALLPGIGVERTRTTFSTNWWVFALAAALVVGVIAWGVVGPDSLAAASAAGLGWVSGSFGWMFGLLTAVVFGYMMWLGFGRHRNIRLGQDDEKPEFSTVSWVAMLFSAGIGIGLLFYGPYEPMTYFLDLPPAFEGTEPGSNPAMHAALAQTIFHWGPVAWAYYALVGGAVAYAAYRKGRSPLISSLLEPIFGKRTEGPLGAVVDSFAIIVTLFGTAVSLGIGALQIGRGVEIVGGVGPLANGAIVGIIAVLAVAFILSAVSGVKRGIRALSNVNMVVAGLLGVFVFVVGPTVLILNLLQGTVMTFVGQFFTLMAQSAATAPDAQAFMDGWTTYYWAWWVSWTPFVGLFIARISRGRTLREFVTTVIVVPSVVCLVWFTVLGGTSMWTEQVSGALSSAASPQDMLFALLAQLPAGTFTSLAAMVSIIIFFVTSADSASIVMAGLSQRGNPTPSRWTTITWGVALAAIASVLLVAGGSVALAGLQSLVIITALPFAFVLMTIMVAWTKDLNRDPLTLRRRYAREALVQGVRTGIEEHGDDFVVGVVPTEHDQGAGAWLDTDDPALTEWYQPEEVAASTTAGDAAAEDVVADDAAPDGSPELTRAR
ncbi:BCCT family transporter [Isoptericola variabilis]|uniref:Choline/carnitine/betaine transporter n=1 Tax=Isoptericola variabilis (strain 225) TaxID=743718 RepID=F6FPR7_ISOV2|nr:BCCT family transporter [Isoptericola variabilis]AEG44799.1 choline/carnitine/betaine transporter [Isoptericola variabilis 225]TWH30685.1 choline/carnitine/betaine transport [Isoptericola variabilis J7]